MIESSPINTDFLSSLLAEDEVGSVIRSHLYVEFQLNYFLELGLWTSEYLKELNLNYSKKVDLACCLGFDKKFRASLQKLGSIRNNFAHNLSSSLSEKVMRDFYNTLPEFGKATVQESVNMLVQTSELKPKPPEYDQLAPKMQFILIVLNLERTCFAACELLRESKK